MKFSVFSDFNNPDKLAVAKELLNVLAGTNCKVSFDEKYVKAFNGFDCAFLSEVTAQRLKLPRMPL